MNDLTNLLNAAIPYAATCVGGALVYEIKKIVPAAIEFIIAKTGITNYKKTKMVAEDIWNSIEENFRLGELAGSKLNAFKNRIKQQFPDITDDEIQLLNKSIAGVFNAGKEAVKQSEEQTIKAIQTVKYYSPDGIELTPVQQGQPKTDQATITQTSDQHTNVVVQPIQTQ